MYVTDEKWAEIIAATEEKIAKWNADAAKHGCPDTFQCQVAHPHADGSVLITKRMNGRGRMTDHSALARNKAGEVRKTKLVFRKGIVTGFKTWPTDPKFWGALASKPASEIVKKLKLVHSIMVIGSSVTSGSSSMIYCGQVFTAEESERLETICREQKVSMDEAILIMRAA